MKVIAQNNVFKATENKRFLTLPYLDTISYKISQILFKRPKSNIVTLQKLSQLCFNNKCSTKIK